MTAGWYTGLGGIEVEGKLLGVTFVEHLLENDNVDTLGGMLTENVLENDIFVEHIGAISTQLCVCRESWTFVL